MAATFLVILSYSVSSYWCFSFDRIPGDDDHKNLRNWMHDVFGTLSGESDRSTGEANIKIIGPHGFVKIMKPMKVMELHIIQSKKKSCLLILTNSQVDIITQ